MDFTKASTSVWICEPCLSMNKTDSSMDSQREYDLKDQSYTPWWPVACYSLEQEIELIT